MIYVWITTPVVELVRFNLPNAVEFHVHVKFEVYCLEGIPSSECEMYQCRRSYSSMFMVPKKDGDQTPVINLKLQLSNHVKVRTLQDEEPLQSKIPSTEGDWMTKIHLKDAFFMVPIADQCQHQ